MIHHRTWSEWFRLRWVAEVYVHHSEYNVETIKVEVGRFYLYAVLRLWVLEDKARRANPFSEVHSWLNWTV